MNQDTIMDTIHQQILTTDDASSVLAVIEKLKNNLYATAGSPLDKLLNTYVSPGLKHAILGELETQKIALTDIAKLEEFFRVLSTSLQKRPVFHITLSIDPSRTLVQSTLHTIHETIDKDAILEVSVDPEIVGGALISFSGIYIDGSIKTKLDSLFATQKTI